MKEEMFMQAKKRDPNNKRDKRIQVSMSEKDKADLKAKADEVSCISRVHVLGSEKQDTACTEY